MSAPIFLPKLPWKPSPKPLPRMASLLRLPWTATRVGLVPHKGATFLLPLCVFVTAWESSCSSAIRITPNPHGFVERSHRTLNQECLSPSRPKTLEEVRQVTEAFATHSNWQRPHQGRACGNQPPRVAFPDLPSLPSVPNSIHPDAWLNREQGQHLVRRVNRQGFVKVDLYPSSISSKLAGQSVTFSIHAKEQSFQVVSPQEYRRSLPLKGLQQRALPYQEDLELMQREASTRTSLACIGEVESPL